ncbi:hypothetical protein BGX27_007545 [Mortierella sp. AM989]|nr:hypothetical protein BGX27_007545 [Mortierella sp. AM989]
MKATPSTTVHEAVQLLKDGKSTRQTAEILNISAATASRILASHKDEMPKDHKMSKGGRPRKITADTVDSLRNNVESGNIKSLDDAKDIVDKMVSGSVSMATVKRRMKEAGLEVAK